MSFISMARQAVEESLRSVMVLDDEYIDLSNCFDRDTGELNPPDAISPAMITDSVKICHGFSNSNIAYRIVKYTRPERGKSQEYLRKIVTMVQNTDLLVLDWQLDGNGDSGEFAANLIRRLAIGRSTRWIYLYTHQDDKRRIAETIYASLFPSQMRIEDLVRNNRVLSRFFTQIGLDLQNTTNNPWTSERVDNIGNVEFSVQTIAEWLGVDEVELQKSGEAINEAHGNAFPDWKSALNTFAQEVVLSYLSGRPSAMDIDCIPVLRDISDPDSGQDTFDILSGGLTVMVRHKSSQGNTSPEHLAQSISETICRKTESFVSALSISLGNGIRKALPSIRTDFSRDDDLVALLQSTMDEKDRPDPNLLLIGRVLDQISTRLYAMYENGELSPCNVWDAYLHQDTPNLAFLRNYNLHDENSIRTIQRLHTHGRGVGLKDPPNGFWNDVSMHKVVSSWARKVVDSVDRCRRGETSCFRLNKPAFGTDDLDEDCAVRWRQIVLRWLLIGDHELTDNIRTTAGRLNSYLNAIDTISIPMDLDFGHVLFDSETGLYYLCISAACDCTRPEGKLPEADVHGRLGQSYHYSFARGSECDIKQALKETRKGTTSFIRSYSSKSDSEVFAVSWESGLVGMPVWPKYMSDRNGIGCHITAVVDGKKRTLAYLQQIRPLFAQMVANRTAANLSRVGVNWVNV